MSLNPAQLLRLMRPRQWVKNAFVVAPLFFTPEAIGVANLLRVALTVMVFCLVSGAVYALNDYCDREADRQHPEKKSRPIASGAVAPAQALLLAVGLVAIAGAIALIFLPLAAATITLVYLVINLLYSLGLKHISIVDTMLIAAGFVLRVDAGAAAIGVEPTVWITLCTGLLALFLALAKRRDDLVRSLDDSHRRSLVGYNLRFIDTALAVVIGVLVVSYIMYTTDAGVMAKFGTNRLYVTVVFVIAGVLRYLQITMVEERSGSPTELALTDRFLILSILGWLGLFAILIYV
jgi:4-hydroxybenzoate polyprenyltransferase